MMETSKQYLLNIIDQKKRSFFGLVFWAIRLSRPYQKLVYIILSAMIVEAAIGLAVPWPLKIVIDNVLKQHPLPNALHWMDTIFHKENRVQLAAVAAFSFVAITVIGTIARFIDNYYNEKVAQLVADDLRRKLYHHLQHLSLSYYDSHQTGKLLSTLTTDVATVQDFASATLLNILVDALTIVGMVGIMFYLDSDFTLIALAVAPFLLFFVARFKKAMKKATHEVRRDQSNMFIVLQKGLESIRAVNAFGRQDYEEGRLKKISDETVHAALKAKRVKSVISPVVAITVAVCTSFVLWRGADLVLKGMMTIGTLTVFLWYMGKFFSPVQDLAKMTSTIAQASVALERIQSILTTNAITPEKINAIRPQQLKGDIVFENVSFGYHPSTIVIKDFSLKINSGQRIGICGTTGSGKSTIVGLIARFYDPISGRILIDDTDISDFTLDGLRNQIAFVMQDTILFYGSIFENIAYGKPDATEAEIIAAAKGAHAHEFICKMPHGYQTLVGERGVTLSGGQRQRISIARALIRNSPILILDEPTSSLDPESEKIVMHALKNLMHGRTVIIIAHRLNTIREANQIVVLNDGAIAETGTHEVLVQRGGLYADLYNMQSVADETIIHK